MGLIKEFKEFAMRGNVIDLAVGVIIGGAFGKIVNSIVTDIIMPPIGVLIGGVKFSDLTYTVKEAVKATTENGIEIPAQPAVTINYGNFIQMVFEFIIIAFSIFIVIKLMNKASNIRKKKEEEAPAPAPEPSNEEKLLTEIRDLLKNK
jgi:large conductance mechanosensitive channel